MNAKETLFTISKKTGYSMSTISRVLSGQAKKYRISNKAITIIRKEAERSNFSPNLIARSLKLKKTCTIGLSIPAIDNPFFSNLAGRVIAHMKDYGYNILLADTMENERNERDALMSFMSRNVDGIIAVPVSPYSVMVESIVKSVPTILIDRYYEDSKLSYVCTDNYAGSYSATQYLIERGYKKIHAIQGTSTSMPNKERVRGFNDAIAAHKSEGVQGSVSGSSFSVENGISETLRIMSGKIRPDAIFAFGTTILLGVINTIKSMGLSVPDDVALISFDDNLFFDYMDPPITRVAQPVAEISHLASDILLKMINGEVDEDEVCKMQLLPKLIHGRSC